MYGQNDPGTMGLRQHEASIGEINITTVWSSAPAGYQEHGG